MEERSVTAAGLENPVEIAVDENGIAHIRAETRHDLFFAQGWNAARDRLWQIDLWRKRGLGLLSKDFGPGYLEQDRAARLFLYRGDMAAEWACYADDAEEICAAFAEGVNAYVAGVNEGRLPMPREFTIAGTRPAEWAAEDVVRIRSHALTRNAISEVLRARLLREAGPMADALRQKLEPAVDLPDAEDVPDLPLEALDVFKLATAPVTFTEERLAATLDDAPRWSKVDPTGEVVEIPPEGSNNWVVSAARSATGRPLMAMDPHRQHALPSLRYMVHLTMPGFDAIGAGEPGVPGVSMGHNGFCAFSLTIFGADQEDICVYDIDPENPLRHRYGDGWETMEVVEESFETRGCAPQAKRLEFTRHGPVIWRSADGRKAAALRSVWWEPGAAAYMASLSVMRSKSHAEYLKALRGWGAPSINHLYADVTGRIGWQTVGLSPIREGFSGLVPVPGDGSCEWAGFVKPEDMPGKVDPEAGFLASANAWNVPKEWSDAHPPLGHEWFEPSRHDRIHEVLAEDDAHGFAEARALQNDVLARPALRAREALRSASLESENARAAADLLLEWDGRMDADSPGAALYELWFAKHLKPALFSNAAPMELHALMLPGDPASVMDALERPDDWFDGDPQAERDELLDFTLASAWSDARARMGGDPQSWRWGGLHKMRFAQAVSRLDPEAELDLEPTPWPGSLSTVMMAAYSPDFTVTSGPSVRFVVDVGDWDASQFTNLPGQSGDPDSPNYGDFLGTWGPDGYRPLPYSAEAVEKLTAERISLTPG